MYAPNTHHSFLPCLPYLSVLPPVYPTMLCTSATGSKDKMGTIFDRAWRTSTEISSVSTGKTRMKKENIMYTPENQHRTWKYALEKEETSTNHQFLGSTLVSGVYQRDVDLVQ